MKYLKEICNINIPNSLHSLLEASILADIDTTLNYDINKHIIQLILNAKSQEEFNNYANILFNIIIPTKEKNDLTNNIVCYISTITYMGKKSYYIDIGRFGKKPYYKIYYSYGRVNVERQNKSIDVKSVDNYTDRIYGVLPKEIITKDLF